MWRVINRVRKRWKLLNKDIEIEESEEFFRNQLGGVENKVRGVERGRNGFREGRNKQDKETEGW